MISDLKQKLPELTEKLDKLRGIFDLEKRQKKITELEKKTALPGFWDDNQSAQALLKEITVNKRWVESHEKLSGELNDIDEFLELAESSGNSEDLKEIEETFSVLVDEINKFEFASFLSGSDDHLDAIVNIHPGAGGTESQDWAQMLFRMYNRWAERKGFSVDLLDYQPGDEAGLKSATFEINGEYAYGFAKAESGVHRLVRISPFDANNRRHTSFVSVHIYPVVAGDIEIEIRDEDVRVDTYRASGAGGQHVNKTSSAIRLTHEPSGIVVTCQSERSQHKNKDAAFTVLKARLYQKQKEEELAKMAKYDTSKKKIEWGSQIRSYVFHPYNMVKDHRTSVETSNVNAVMEGEIDPFIDAFLSDPELNQDIVG
ncbi:MAG: peptide chain release factor 2 [bacterium]|nr:peptide chain release factor 2 [bacterium]